MADTTRLDQAEATSQKQQQEIHGRGVLQTEPKRNLRSRRSEPPHSGGRRIRTGYMELLIQDRRKLLEQITTEAAARASGPYTACKKKHQKDRQKKRLSIKWSQIQETKGETK